VNSNGAETNSGAPIWLSVAGKPRWNSRLSKLLPFWIGVKTAAEFD
jgi:hypothetical protein